MSANREAAVLGWGLCLQGFPSATAWRAGEPVEPFKPSGALIERRSRRRCSLFTRAIADAYGEALAASGFDGSLVATVFGSALGEVGTMIRLLDTMWRGTDPMSPMAFAMSVHNAASGVVSISSGNRGFTTSIGADYDTPAMALHEAFGLLGGGFEAVMVTCGDEGVLTDLVPAGTEWSLTCGALALAPVELAPDAPRMARPVLGARRPEEAHRADLSPAGARNPCAGIVDVIDALAAGWSGPVVLDRGDGAGWTAAVTPAGPR